MAVQGCAQCVKYTLFFVNFIIFVCGIAVLAIGIWTVVDRAFMEQLLGSNLYVSSAYILIAAGAVVTVISFFGCYGAIQENPCMLMTFFIILFMLFILMLAGGILAYVFRSEVDQIMQGKMAQSIADYSNVTAVTDAWDAVQVQFKCCGMAVGNDPSYEIWQNENKHLETAGKKVPDSCCKKKDAIKACQDDPKNQAHAKDCLVEIKAFVKDHALILGGIGIGIACVLLVGMIFSCALCLIIK